MVERPEYSAQEEPVRNSPRITRFQSLDTPADYYVFVEQKVYIKVTAFSVILFTWFSSHYIFNLEYHKYYENAAMFIPETDSRKKKAGYLTVATELSHTYEQLNED